MTVILKAIPVLLLLAVLPVLAGSVARRLAGVQYGSRAANMITAFLFGQLALWALFEPGTVLLILAGKTLSRAVLLWAALVLAFCAGGLLYLYRTGKLQKSGQPFFAVPEGARLQFVLALAAAAALIGYQCWKYIFQMHTDDDDSRFIAEAVEAYQKGTMLKMNPATGETVTGFPGELYKDVTSPWMMYLAMLAKLCSIHPAIMGHTIWPAVLLLAAYAAYYLIGLTLFDGDRVRGMLFTAAVAFLQLFFGGSTHTQSAFTLVRIWQGKAAFAAAGLPVLFLIFQGMYREEGVQAASRKESPGPAGSKEALPGAQQRKGERPGSPNGAARERSRWFFLLFAAETAFCLMSGMGIVLGAAAAGIFALWYVPAFRKWRQIPLFALCVLLNIVLALMNVYLKG